MVRISVALGHVLDNRVARPSDRETVNVRRPRAIVFGFALWVCGCLAFTWTWRHIGWMASGGARDFLVLGALILSAGAALTGFVAMFAAGKRLAR